MRSFSVTGRPSAPQFMAALAISIGIGGMSACATSPKAGSPMPLSQAVEAMEWEVLGTSREGRPIRASTIIGQAAEKGAGVRAAVIAGIHGNEREGGRHLQELLPLLFTCAGTIRVYEDVNPDGTARDQRTTIEGVDPNRNWPAKNFKASKSCGPTPLSEPGVAAVHGDLVHFAPDIVIVLHSTGGGPFVNYDGPAEEPAAKFSDAAGPPWSVQPSMGYPTPGSLGSWMGVDRQVPILTIEFHRGCSSEESGPALLAGVAAVLGGTVPRGYKGSMAPGDPTSGKPLDDEFSIH